MEIIEKKISDMTDAYMLEKELSYKEQSAEEVRENLVQNIVGAAAVASSIETYLVSRS